MQKGRMKVFRQFPDIKSRFRQERAKPMKNRAQIKKEAQNTYEENYDINKVQEEFDDIYEDFDE